LSSVLGPALGKSIAPWGDEDRHRKNATGQVRDQPCRHNPLQINRLWRGRSHDAIRITALL